MGFGPPKESPRRFQTYPSFFIPFCGFDAMIAEAKKRGIHVVIDKAASGEHLLDAIEKHLCKVAPSIESPITEPKPQTRTISRRKSTSQSMR
jgi:hypothetical protein